MTFGHKILLWGFFFFFCGWLLWKWIDGWPEKPQSSKTGRAITFPGSEKPFPSVRPPDNSSPNPYKPVPRAFYPFAEDTKHDPDDRYVYWEDEEGLHQFDIQAEWESYREEFEANSPLKLPLPSVFTAFPDYDYSMDYPEYKRWKDFCVKHDHIIPFRIFKEFDD